MIEFRSHTRLTRRLCVVFYLAGLFAARVWAGNFVSDFATNVFAPPAPSLYGSAQVIPGSGAGGYLRLTSATNDLQGSFILPNLDSGARVASFTATFKVLMGGGSGADGFSFNFAGDLPNGSFGEEGAGSGLKVSFDTYDNGGGEAPAVEARFGDNLIGRQSFGGLRTGISFVNVEVVVDALGKLTVSYNGVEVLPGAFGYVPIAGRFGLGARTGGLTDNHWVDDLNIQTTPVTGPYPMSISPLGDQVGAGPTIHTTLEDYQTAVVTSSVSLLIDGSAVSASVSKSGSVTTITYQPPAFFGNGTRHTARVNYSDNGTPAAVRSYQWEFGISPNALQTIIRNAPSGYSIISNPFRTLDDTLDSIAPNMPRGSIAYVWSAQAGKYTSSVYVNGWKPNLTVPVGYGFFLFLQNAHAIHLTGEPLPPGTVFSLPSGFNLMGSLTNQPVTINQMNFPPANGDTAYFFDAVTDRYRFAQFDEIDGAWVPVAEALTPISPGEGFFLFLTSPRNWTRPP